MYLVKKKFENEPSFQLKETNRRTINIPLQQKYRHDKLRTEINEIEDTIEKNSVKQKVASLEKQMIKLTKFQQD